MTEKGFLSKLADKAVFSDIEIHDAELVDTTAYDVSFKNCAFVRCDMTNNCWEGLRASSSTFLECDFRNSNFEDASFERCNFFPSEASEGCNFMHTRLRSASFAQCRISSCIFEGADVLWINIEDSEAVGAKFFRVHFDGAATLTRSVFKYADLRGADLSTCDVSHNDFVWAVLDEVNFEQATLIGSDLSGASLRFTKFTQADLRGTILGSLDIRSTDLENVKIFEYQMRGLLENCGLIIYPAPHSSASIL